MLKQIKGSQKKLPIEYLPEAANSFPKALEEQYIPLEPKINNYRNLMNFLEIAHIILLMELMNLSIFLMKI